MHRRNLGWLGPGIVLVGAAVAAVGVWYMVHARPVAGAVIDTIAVDGRRALVVRGEAGGDRAFVELRDGDALAWQALVPHYSGRPGAPGIAWSRTAVSVRVVRDGRAELFALAIRDGSKLGGMQLAPSHGPIVDHADRPRPVLRGRVGTGLAPAGGDRSRLGACAVGARARSGARAGRRPRRRPRVDRPGSRTSRFRRDHRGGPPRFGSCIPSQA
ncbi:MAG: hypothetical protein E6J90_20340 [Deltaproteobacteria bacterium]|nr:MAG: hypothetical protein E6J90_20340 [Deltaproteobacteria bacterium]